MPWTRLVEDASVKPGSMASHLVREGLPVLVAKSAAGQVYAADDMCTHAEAPLSDGILTGTQVMCYLHQAVFDLAKQGAVVLSGGPGTIPLRVFATEIREGWVWADIPDGPPPKPGILSG
ncbi:MAG TPA: Rieske 2Fe-2S domain-containing protein [Candidatus Thermoplasmatota archaeon]|nr:Rieske 2Fe-2S domain-containing protein [Candidatus Thermoplasmatota archaeon]